MPTLFYQSFWNIVGDKFTYAVLTCLNEGHVPCEINFTHIVLIPKTKQPEKMTQYQPISLCNVLYKLIAKVLANWLKFVFRALIFENQSAFILGRLNSDNIMVAFETLQQYMKSSCFNR